MPKVQGVKEKLHYPLYDAFYVNPDDRNRPTFRQTMSDPRVIRFFVDVQNKTRLETNLQAAGVLPSLNTFEARAMRVVMSNIPDIKRPNIPDIKRPQTEPRNDELLAELIYNSVTSLIVGEKIMIEMPTFWFPAGAGVFPSNGAVTNHGEPDPMATFRFAEPVFIEPQQNFRVEIAFPRGVPGDGTPPDPLQLAGLTGPLWVWVALDGYLTRDVQ